jgi:hypothetical protein
LQGLTTHTRREETEKRKTNNFEKKARKTCSLIHSETESRTRVCPPSSRRKLHVKEKGRAPYAISDSHLWFVGWFYGMEWPWVRPCKKLSRHSCVPSSQFAYSDLNQTQSQSCSSAQQKKYSPLSAPARELKGFKFERRPKEETTRGAKSKKIHSQPHSDLESRTRVKLAALPATPYPI